MLGLMLQEAQEPEEAPMVQMLGALPKDMQQALEQSLRQAMEGGIPSAMRTLMGEDQSQNTLQRLTGLREQLEKQEQSQKTPITVRHYHCDHLGTPIALSDREQNIVWAAKLDPWGNVEEEFNPHRIEQSIRLPGQHHDRDTGLYYNRHRYYDPSIGSYINQDPIGWLGGVNGYMYPVDPNRRMDPIGLQSFPTDSFPGMGAGTAERASLGMHMMQQGATPEQISRALYGDQSGGFLGRIIDKFKEGGQAGASVGGTGVAGLGVSASAGTATDQTGLTCVTSTVCGIIGPMVGGFSSAGYAAQTGKVSPGDVSWSIGGIGAATVGWGGKAEFSIGTDGALGIQGGGSLGGALGGAIQICRQVTTNTCANPR